MSDETKTTPPALSAEAASATTPSPATEAAPANPPEATDPNAKIPRPLQVIRIEYTNLCARLGQLVYNISIAEEEKEDLLREIFARAKEEHDLPESMKKEAVNLQPAPPAAQA
jgi:hypothetical protein